MLRLIDLGAIVIPLTIETTHEHEYFFETAFVDFVIKNGEVRRRNHNQKHELISALKNDKDPGLVLFSTGTTGRPKAILHNLNFFLKRFETPRATLRTINFLLFDHIGGINTLLHTLFNKGVVIAPESRSVESILNACQKYDVEVLPTTPTFLRLMLMSGMIPDKVPDSLRIITYGTELMDQTTLDQLCDLLPSVDFRQTYGMSELGILRVKTDKRNSLYMRVGGEGVETRIINNVLQIRSESRMCGYLNAESPFDSQGWYDTKDVVAEKGDSIKITGRTTEVVNVGGLKFMASEVELVALDFPSAALVKAYAKKNPITGQHLELLVEPRSGQKVDKSLLKAFLKERLQPHMVPKRIIIQSLDIGHRFKKA